MLCWRNRGTPNTPPPWLVGAAHMSQTGNGIWFAAAPPLRPARIGPWTPCGPGWETAISDGDPGLARLMRNPRWTIAGIVEDARGLQWAIPHILGPDGTPVVARVRRLLPDGTWSREAADELQRNAVESCTAVRNLELSEEEQTAAILSLLECCYFCNAATFGVLGLVDDVLVDLGLRLASGLIAED